MDADGVTKIRRLFATRARARSWSEPWILGIIRTLGILCRRAKNLKNPKISRFSHSDPPREAHGGDGSRRARATLDLDMKDLKAILRARGVPTAGTREALIRRVEGRE